MGVRNLASYRVLACGALAAAMVLADIAAAHPSESRQQTSPTRAATLSRSWKQLRTPAFTIVGDAPESVLNEIRTDLEAFRAAVRQAVPAFNFSSPVQTSVVVFKDNAEFSSFKPRDSRGKPMPNVGGYFYTRPYGNFIVFGSAGQPFDLRLIFHEYTHYLVHRSGRPLPGWMDEGLSDFYSTFKRRWQGKTVLGWPSAERLAALRNRTFIPVRTIVTPQPDQMEEIWRSPGRIGQYYAESWALVHYLIVERKASISSYLDALGDARSQDEAFRRAFGVDLDTINRELQTYVRRFSFSALVAEPVDDASPTVQATRMREADVRLLRGRLLGDSSAYAEAESELQAALALDPEDIDARIELARNMSQRDRRSEAVALLDEIVKAAPSHPPAHYFHGVELAASWRHADALAAFERAVTLNASVSEPWMRLSASALALGRDQQAAAALRRGLDLDSNPELYRVHAGDAFAVARNLAAAAAARTYPTLFT